MCDLGVCGTDAHIHEGEFISKFPVRVYLYCSFVFRVSYFVWLNGNRQLIPGHEAIGSVVEFGENVKGFEKGDRCAADVGITVSSIVLGMKGLGV